MADTQQAGPPPSAWSPLAVPAFRTVWTATLVANIGAWVASVGTGWLMTTLDPSPIWVSLVGAATALPMFLFALPAGALADIVDRRKLLIVAQIFMLAVMVVLCALTVMGAVTPITLLILIFVLEAGSAFETPAFLAVLPQLVPKNELGPALALNGLGINISRVIGPALGGLVIGLAGVGATFLINALTFFAVIFAYASWRPPAHTSHLPAERFTAAIRSGWRFTREAPALKATLVHAGTFFLFASAYWALLPLIARDQLGGGAHVYGMLFGAIGAGAVAGALVLPAIRGRISPDRLVLGGGLVTAAATAALAATHTLALAMPIMLVIGAAWLAVMSSLMVAAQVALPEWVKARGLAVTQMVFNGGLMFGSVLWGVVADQWGIPWALVLSAGGLAAASVATLRWRLPGDDSLDLRPSRHWPAPVAEGDPARRSRAGAGHRRIHRRARGSRRLRRGAGRQRAHPPPRRRDLLAPLHRHRRSAPPPRGVRGRELARAYAPARARHPRGSGGRGRGAEIPRRSGPAARVAFHQRDLAGVMGGDGCAGAEGGRTPIPFSTVIAGLDPAIHRPWMNGFLRWMPGSSPGMTTRGTVTSVRYLTQGAVGLIYGGGVAERSTMVVGPLPRPSGRFLPRLGPAAPACGASFVSALRARRLPRSRTRSKNSAPARGRRANLVSTSRFGS